MPPTANNPNPDRASRRSAAPATAETVTEGNNGAADAPPAPALAVAVALQPQPARATAPATANAAQEATEPAPRATVVLKAPTLFNKDGAVAPSRKRKACPTRDAPEWAAVSILNGGESQTPQVQCNFCGKTFCATAARVKNHLLGLNGSAACQGDSEAFIQLKENLLGKVTEKAETKQRKTAAAAIMSSAMSSTCSSSISTGKGFMQQHIQESFAHATSECSKEGIELLQTPANPADEQCIARLKLQSSARR
ncbi:hypothetical protein AB1Y20_001946 [Prymnesium parvum]|uniref:BED-type domain-containing protein n=1 Tax=Prymnesium parvum TaxID=97485 RepID=A0AB34J952_PRYPA